MHYLLCYLRSHAMVLLAVGKGVLVQPWDQLVPQDSATIMHQAAVLHQVELLSGAVSKSSCYRNWVLTSISLLHCFLEVSASCDPRAIHILHVDRITDNSDSGWNGDGTAMKWVLDIDSFVTERALRSSSVLTCCHQIYISEARRLSWLKGMTIIAPSLHRHLSKHACTAACNIEARDDMTMNTQAHTCSTSRFHQLRSCRSTSTDKRSCASKPYTCSTIPSNPWTYPNPNCQPFSHPDCDPYPNRVRSPTTHNDCQPHPRSHNTVWKR